VRSRSLLDFHCEERTLLGDRFTHCRDIVRTLQLRPIDAKEIRERQLFLDVGEIVS
jgi:hypothetical protein